MRVLRALPDVCSARRDLKSTSTRLPPILSGSGHKFDDVSPPYAHRIPTLDNIVIYGGDTVGIWRDNGQAPYVMELMLVTTKGAAPV
jgi:hypothetical protein